MTMVRNKTLQLDKRARIKLRTGERSRVRIRRVMLAVIMTAIMAVPAAALAMEVDIPYQQTFTNDSAEASVANTFDYELTPADASSPMPAGSTGGAYGFSLSGNTSGSLNLDITYPKAGYYYYTVKSKVDSPQQGYTYNAKTYTVMVMIVNGSEGLEIGAITIQDADKNKYDRLVFDTRYYKARPGGGGGGNDGGAGGGGAGGGAAGVAPPAGAPGGGTGNPPTTINDPKPPLAGTKHGEDYWALVNLICMLLTWLTAIVAGILYIKRRREAPDEEEADLETEEYEDPQKLKRKGLLRILIVLVAIISLIVFILTEDMTLPMELVDEYTIWMIIFLAAALLLALISRKVTEETEEMEATPEG